MKLAAGVDVIEAPFWGRPLNLVVFRGRQHALVDTGLRGQPADFIVPALNSLGLTPRDLSLIINTHAHIDHIGGNEELWRASEKRTRFAAHRLERTAIEDPRGHTRQVLTHYADLGLMTADDLERHMQAAGNGVGLAHVLDGGEVFDLGDDVSLEIVFTPGHSAGHVVVLDRRSKVLVQGEAIAGVGLYNIQGDLVGAPVYKFVESYLRTIAVVATLDFETLVPAHQPPMDRKEAVAFLGDSLNFTTRLETELSERLQSRSQPVTALELWRSMDGLWGRYPANMPLYLVLEAHLKGLIRRSVASGSLTGGLTWAGPEYDGLAALVAQARAAIERMPR